LLIIRLIELLVAFFASATPLLNPTVHGASIIITLFEGSPYTLWNIRDLARHSGLEVAQSFRFQASAYPGYRHARTIGVVRGGGGWRGEERGSRSFVFVRRGEGVVQGPGKKGREESSDDESGSEEGNWDAVEREQESEGEGEEEEFDDVDEGRGEHDHVDTLERDSESHDESASDEEDEFEGFENEDERDGG
jgi:25S rRNA (uracil2634-N3)-methyltransferase